MQRALSLRPPYGTMFVAQLDGSVWLYYETTKIEVSTIVNWLRDIALEHQAQCIASDEAMKQAQENLKKIPKTEREREEKLRAHDWGGPYKLGVKCKNCEVVANGLEPVECSQ